MTLHDYAMRQVEKHLGRFEAHVKAVLSAPSPDAIHDLRVATRRLSQALRVFRDALPEGVPNQIRGQMSEIRQEAGAMRDGDVMAGLFRSLKLGPTHRVFREIAQQRTAEEQKLKDSLAALAATGYRETWRAALSAHGTEEQDAVLYARGHLSRECGKYMAAGRRLVRKSRTPEQLHKFRILTKRFRYTLEMFSDLYGPGLQQRLGRLRTVQETLGNLNDCVVASAMLRRFDPFHRLLPRLAAEALACESSFRYFWDAIMSAPGEEWRWVRYFRYSGRAPVTAGPQGSM